MQDETKKIENDGKDVKKEKCNTKEVTTSARYNVIGTDLIFTNFSCHF